MIRKLIYFRSMEEVENFVRITSSHKDISVDVKMGKYVVDGKSYLGVLALGICKDLILEINHDDGTILKDLHGFMIKNF